MYEQYKINYGVILYSRRESRVLKVDCFAMQGELYWTVVLHVKNLDRL